MSSSNNDPSSRKPSGSSTRSSGHSPTNSPSNTNSQRKLAPSAGANNMFGVAMGTTNTLKGLNSGWQVWGNTAPSSKRTTSISSVASGPDVSSAQGENHYRPNLGEPWNATRSSGAWEEPHGSPNKKDLYQLRQSSSGLPAPRMDERSAGLPKAGQYSPQRFEGTVGKDTGVTPRYSVAVSPSKSTSFNSSTSVFPNQQSVIVPSASGGGYESSQTSTAVDTDLSMALRGMTVEDDYGVSHANGQLSSTSQPNNGPNHSPPGTMPHMRVAHPMQQARVTYGTYPHPEYNTYYIGPQAGQVDYPYSYDSYRGVVSDPSVYASPAAAPSPTSVYPTPGLFYDYTGAARPPASQFYYPTQPIVYHPPPTHSPMMTPQLSAAVPATLGDKKRELQFSISQQQQLSTQNMLYPSLRSPPSPHTQGYGVDYSQQVPMMIAGGALYGHSGLSPQSMTMYGPGGRPGRRDGNDAGMALRSPLLEEFRANKSRKWELRDIAGYIVEFSGDQHGSRFIQQKLETATSEEKQGVFDEIVPNNALQLIQDVFGNYVIQKLFEHGTQVQKTLLANTMDGHILPLSLQMYGCRVVQKAVEFVLPEQQGAFVKELEPHVMRCVKDANGNHVIQKLIERVAPERLGFVNSFKGNVFELATHPYGCRVLQRCFEHLPEDSTRPLLDELHKYNINLMQDQFGNYVIQFVLEHGKPQDRSLIVSKLRGQMLNMARHKFASNVCEKALITADPENRRLLIEEIMTPKQDGVSPLVTMMKDQFANYVLQRALTVVEGDQKEMLVGKVRPQLASMRRYSSAYSKHLLSIERLLERVAPSGKAGDRAHFAAENATTISSDGTLLSDPIY